MKRIFYFLALMLVVSTFHSCGVEEEFDETLLVGKWKQISGPEPVLNYRYDSNGSGVTWNDEDGVNESQGRKFTWRLVKSELTQIHIMGVGQTNPTFILTVIELTDKTLKYKDEFDRWTFNRL